MGYSMSTELEFNCVFCNPVGDLDFPIGRDNCVENYYDDI